MLKKLAIAAALAAAFSGGAFAATTTVSNGSLMAAIGDNGTFDMSGGPGTPGLSWGGTEFVNIDVPASWFVFNASGTDMTSYSIGPTSAFAGSLTTGGGFAATTAAIGGWSFSQVVLAANPDKLTVTLNITNNTGAAVAGMYSVGFDPDQGGSGSNATVNEILATGGASAVSATAAGKTVTLQNDTSASAFSIFPYINVGDCCSAVSPVGTAFQGVAFTTSADDSINLIYDLGRIANGQTVSIGYSYMFAPVPEPGTYALLIAGLGAIGFIAKRRKMM
ncbi:MAG: PEP-CTERM sorting domain-containing protein [Burkholderiales bacterium]